MRRIVLTVLLLAAGAGLLTGALAPAASAASSQVGTVTVLNPGNQAGVTGTAITPLQLHATDTDMVAIFAWTAGGLPTGLVINPATGLVSGTPALAGTYSVTVTAVEAVATVTPTATPSASMTTPAPTMSPTMAPTATATKPATASAYFTPFGQVIFEWVITGTAGAMPTATPTAFPSGGVVTGGGGSLGGTSAGLAAGGAVLLLGGAGYGTFAWRRSRKARTS